MTGDVARTNMDRLDRELTTVLELAKVEIYLFSKYDDDINLATSVIPKGWSWTKKVTVSVES